MLGPQVNEMHLVIEFASLATLRTEYADLLTATTDTMRAFSAQSNCLRVLHYVIDCLSLTNAWSLLLGGTCNQDLLAAEACTTCLLLLTRFSLRPSMRRECH